MSKQHQVIAEVLNRALHHLRELNIPCIVLLPNSQIIPINISAREADALIEDAAQYSCALREKMIEKKADDVVYEKWRQDDDTKD